MKYRKKAVVIDAHRWFKNGDHPEDGNEVFNDGEFKGELLEGKIIRYYRSPYIDEEKKCCACGSIMHIHGWIDTLEAGHRVCPGDWIIRGIGVFYPCKSDIFEKRYEKVD